MWFKVAPATRYPPDPRALFVLSLCVVSGLPLVLGISKPGSVESLIPSWAVVVWGALLTGGAVTSLAGMVKQTVGGIIAEQIGSVAVGSATIFYSTAILLSTGWQGVLPAGIILGWGLSCMWRWVQLASLLSSAQHQAADERRYGA